MVGDEGALLGVISEADLMAAIAESEPVERRCWRPRPVHRGVLVARPGARTAGELMSVVLVTIVRPTSAGDDATAPAVGAATPAV